MENVDKPKLERKKVDALSEEEAKAFLSEEKEVKTVEEAISGAKITVPTLNGKVAVTVPAFSSSGEKLRLKGLGIKSKSGQGDEIINLQIILPKVKSDNLAEAAEKMENYAVRSF